MTILRRFPWSCTSAVVVAAFIVIGSVDATAQATSGSISGTVTDSSGATIKGATVKLIDTDRGETIRTVMTNSSGFYTATFLPLGTYNVEVTDQGFKTAYVNGLVLHVNDALTVNQTLAPGSTTQSVTVQASQVQLNLENATSEGLINSTQINEMVLSTRNYEQLVNLQPGVAFGGASDQIYVGPTNPTGGSNQVNFSVNGGRNTSNNWTIDGADNVDRGANLTLLTFPSVDAIAEFKTLRGQYSAQFGRSASGQIDVITKSGSNAIHGSAYEFIRNDVGNANGYFSNLSKIPRAKYRYNDFGFSFGGPVYIPKVYNGHDKTFFFVSEEFRRFITYTSGPAALVPTADERTGNFTNDWYQNSNGGWVQGPVPVCTAYNTSNGICTASGTTVSNISPTAKAYLKDVYGVIPTPPSALDASIGLDPHTLTSTLANTFNNDNTVVRIDQQFGQKLSVFYRYLHDTFPTFQGAGTFVAVPIPGISPTISHSPGTQHLGHATYVFTPTLLADIGYAYSNGSIQTVPEGALLSSASTDVNPPLPFANVLGVVPTIGVSGMTTLGGAGVYNDHDINHNAFGSVTKTIGNNTIIVGATYNHLEKMENNNAGGNQGSFSFITSTSIPQTNGATADNAFANFLLGNANGGFTQQSTAITVDMLENIFEAYVQDNWRATPRLSLNAGVRYGYYGQPSDGDGRLNNFDPALYSPAGAPTIDSTGLICFTAPCANANKLNNGVPNPGANYNGVNYINGMIFAGPSYPNNQKSPFGSKVGQADNLNFAPRFGFAYDLFGNGRTAVRGGYGWSYDEAATSYYETTIFDNPPAVTTYSLTTAVLDNPTAGNAGAASPSTTPGRLQAVPINYHTPYVQQFSLDVQHSITPTFLLDVGYFGTTGVHLLGLVDVDEPQPGSYVGKVSPLNYSSTCVYPGTTTPAFISTACDRPLNQIKPYLGYFAIDSMQPIYSSNYNSLQVKATKHFSGHSYFDVNYTWSRALTNGQNDYSTPAQNTYNLAAEYGRAAVDRTNVLNLDGVFELPWFRDQLGLKGRLIGGWELSAIYSVNSGLPLTATSSSGSQINYGYTSVFNNSTVGGYPTDNAGLSVLGNTDAGLRPNQLGNPNVGHGQSIHNRLQWFYRGAFASPSPTSTLPGDEPRGAINGPGFNRADVGLFRNFRIIERLSFQFRAEAYNVANHTNWQGVTTSVTSTSYGQVTSNRDARILQLGGKFTF